MPMPWPASSEIQHVVGAASALAIFFAPVSFVLLGSIVSKKILSLKKRNKAFSCTSTFTFTSSSPTPSSSQSLLMSCGDADACACDVFPEDGDGAATAAAVDCMNKEDPLQCDLAFPDDYQLEEALDNKEEPPRKGDSRLSMSVSPGRKRDSNSKKDNRKKSARNQAPVMESSPYSDVCLGLSKLGMDLVEESSRDRGLSGDSNLSYAGALCNASDPIAPGDLDSPTDLRNSKGLSNPRDLSNPGDLSHLRGLGSPTDPSNPRDFGNPRDLSNLKDLSSLTYPSSPRDFRHPKDLIKPRGVPPLGGDGIEDEATYKCLLNELTHSIEGHTDLTNFTNSLNHAYNSTYQSEEAKLASAKGVNHETVPSPEVESKSSNKTRSVFTYNPQTPENVDGSVTISTVSSPEYERTKGVVDQEAGSVSSLNTSGNFFKHISKKPESEEDGSDISLVASLEEESFGSHRPSDKSDATEDSSDDSSETDSEKDPVQIRVGPTYREKNASRRSQKSPPPLVDLTDPYDSLNIDFRRDSQFWYGESVAEPCRVISRTSSIESFSTANCSTTSSTAIHLRSTNPDREYLRHDLSLVEEERTGEMCGGETRDGSDGREGRDAKDAAKVAGRESELEREPKDRGQAPLLYLITPPLLFGQVAGGGGGGGKGGGGGGRKEGGGNVSSGSSHLVGPNSAVDPDPSCGDGEDDGSNTDVDDDGDGVVDGEKGPEEEGGEQNIVQWLSSTIAGWLPGGGGGGSGGGGGGSGSGSTSRPTIGKNRSEGRKGKDVGRCSKAKAPAEDVPSLPAQPRSQEDFEEFDVRNVLSPEQQELYSGPGGSEGSESRTCPHSCASSLCIFRRTLEAWKQQLVNMHEALDAASVTAASASASGAAQDFLQPCIYCNEDHGLEGFRACYSMQLAHVFWRAVLKFKKSQLQSHNCPHTGQQQQQQQQQLQHLQLQQQPGQGWNSETLEQFEVGQREPCVLGHRHSCNNDYSGCSQQQNGSEPQTPCIHVLVSDVDLLMSRLEALKQEDALEKEEVQKREEAQKRGEASVQEEALRQAEMGLTSPSLSRISPSLSLPSPSRSLTSPSLSLSLAGPDIDRELREIVEQEIIDDAKRIRAEALSVYNLPEVTDSGTILGKFPQRFLSQVAKRIEPTDPSMISSLTLSPPKRTLYVSPPKPLPRTLTLASVAGRQSSRDKLCGTGSVAEGQCSNDKLCGAGSVAEGQSSNEKLCGAGSVARGQSSNEKLCGAGSVARVQSSNEKVCGAGIVARGQSSNNTLCGAGSVARVQSSNEKLCGAGSVARVQSSNEKLCGAGIVARGQSSNNTLCGAGSVARVQSSNEKLCGAGSVARGQSSNDTLCGAGSVARGQSSNEKLCGAGSVAKGQSNKNKLFGVGKVGIIRKDPSLISIVRDIITDLNGFQDCPGSHQPNEVEIPPRKERQESQESREDKEDKEDKEGNENKEGKEDKEGHEDTEGKEDTECKKDNEVKEGKNVKFAVPCVQGTRSLTNVSSTNSTTSQTLRSAVSASSSCSSLAISCEEIRPKYDSTIMQNFDQLQAVMGDLLCMLDIAKLHGLSKNKSATSGSSPKKCATSGSPPEKGSRSGSPLAKGARSGSPLVQDARSGSPLVQGARSRSPLAKGATSGIPLVQGARSRSPLVQGARSGSPLGQGARSRSPPGKVVKKVTPKKRVPFI